MFSIIHVCNLGVSGCMHRLITHGLFSIWVDFTQFKDEEEEIKTKKEEETEIKFDNFISIR